MRSQSYLIKVHYQKVLKALGHGTNLAKIDYDLVKLGYPVELDKAAQNIRGRSKYHLYRMLQKGRSKVEQTFALDFIAFGCQIVEEYYTSNKVSAKLGIIRSVINGEGRDTCMWWTLAPYIYNLLGNGEKAKKTQRIIDWAATASPENKFHSLAGMSYYNYGYGLTFVLDHDPTHYSHTFAREEATRLITEVFSKI